MQLLDGRRIAHQMLESLAVDISALAFRPFLVDVVVDDNPVTMSYTAIKSRAARRMGCGFRLIKLAKTASSEEVISTIEQASRVNDVCGLIVQLPLPRKLNRQAILDAIPEGLDVDCIGSRNLQAFYGGTPRFLPPTGAAVLCLVESLPFDFTKKSFLVVGQGELVGRPVFKLLKSRGLKVTVADSQTPDLGKQLERADVIVSATGQPGLISGINLKPGVALIDAGAAEVAGNIVGDVDVSAAKARAGWLSPVPGGVGPVAVAMLFRNLLAAA